MINQFEQEKGSGQKRVLGPFINSYGAITVLISFLEPLEQVTL